MSEKHETRRITPTAAFLARAHITDNPEGDLIADMRSELRRGADMPEIFHSQRELQAYLSGKGACPEALAAVPGVWQRYRRWLDRNCWRAWSLTSKQEDAKNGNTL
jgi:hypothetical protein